MPKKRHERVTRGAWPGAKWFVAALLPEDAYAALRQVLREAQFLPARSWNDLNRIVGSRTVTSIVIDPLVGDEGLAPAISLLRQFPFTPTIAYVSLSPQNVQAVSRLGNEGLHEAFLHPLPDSGRRLRALHEKLAAAPLARTFLGTLGPSAGRLPHHVARAVVDLFARPHRYKTATDLAAQSEVLPRQLYRDFDAVRLGSPRKLVIAAKILRAYTYLRYQQLPVKHVSEKLGYEAVRILARHTARIFGCCPSTLRQEPDGEEVVRQVLEWYYKPTNRAAGIKSLWVSRWSPDGRVSRNANRPSTQVR